MADLEDLFEGLRPGGPADIDRHMERMRRRIEEMQERLRDAAPVAPNLQMQVLRFDNATVQIQDDQGSIVIETRDGTAIAVVEPEQYNLAVGKNGHNVRLAGRLCGFEIQVKTEDQYREFLSSSDSRMMVEQLFKTTTDETSLTELPLEPRVIELLEAGGIFSVEELVETSLEELMKIDGIGEKTAKKILEIIEEVVDFEEDEEGDEEEASSEETDEQK